MTPSAYRLRLVAPFSVALIVMAAVAYSLRYKAPELLPESPKPIEDRCAELRWRIAEQQGESARAIDAYSPKFRARYDDPATPFADTLKAIPGVVAVEVASVEKPNGRIIHFRDLHFVPKPLVAIDMSQAYGRELSPAEVEVLYEQHLLEVELVQAEQMAVLRCLIRHHGLKMAFSEGFSPEDDPVYLEKIAVLIETERDDIPELKKQLATVRKMREGVDGELLEKIQASESKIVGLLERHNRHLLEVGSAGRLLVTGELKAVLPIEERVPFEEAKPLQADGLIRKDATKLAARNDAQIRTILKQDRFAVVMLDGSHDLSESIKRVAKGKIEYLRVTTNRYQELAD